jgi:predicted N-acetyltransferase YhbS
MVQIDYLADHLQVAPLLAEWHHTEWKHLLPGWTFEGATAELLAHTARRHLPTTFVAIEHGRVVGSTSLLGADLAGWEHLSPWVASVYVVPERRGAGIGRRLVARASEEAGLLGFHTVFLWTVGQQGFYERLGWKAIATARQGSVDVIVMRQALRG